MSVISGMRAKRAVLAALVALAVAFGVDPGIDPTRGGGAAVAAPLAGMDSETEVVEGR